MASLLMKDVQLLVNNKQQYSHGKIMSVGGNAALTINKSLTAKESITLAEKELLATHYYIKFMPANDADYAKLKADTNLIIYPFPLHTNSNQYGSNYRDPAVPANVPTYQYASVLVNYVLPNVPYVKLADLYLPDERSNAKPITITGAGNSSYSVTGLALVNESLCDDEPVLPTYARLELPPEDCDGDYGGGGPGTGTGAPPGEWRPSGRITMNDDALGTIGVEGIKVRAYRWFTSYSGITDADGYYHVDGTYTRPANYWFEFERYDFSVNNHGGGPKEVSGPKQEAPWNIDLTGYNKFCATIFRAAFHYYHKDIQGLRRPPQNSFWATQMKLGAYNYKDDDGANANHSPQRRFFGIGEAIHIYKPFNDEFSSSTDIYATTIHELAHAVHWDMAAGDYRNANDNVSESWPVGVQWTLTKMVYPTYLGRPNGTTNYTNLIMDLIDLPGQEYTRPALSGGLWYFGTGNPNDQVQGYNIVQVQNALIGVRNLEAWKNNLFYQYENSTENNLDPLFTYWASY